MKEVVKMKSKYFLIVAGLMLVLFSYSSAQVPQMINYQGKLTKSSGAPLDTTISMIFSIYADSAGTILKWTETQGAVVVEKGIFNVLLGNVNPIPDTVFNGNIRYLGVKVGGDPEITPRKPMVSVPYAYRAGSGEGANCGWIDDGGVVRLETSTDMVGIGTTSPNEQVEITGNLRLPATTATAGIIKVGADRFIHNYGTDNTFVGENAGNLTMTGTSNTATGGQALYFNTTGTQNTANGYEALLFNTTGNGHTANGYGALRHNTTGTQNTATGWGALFSNTTGSSNTANGFMALFSNTTGIHNTANGYGALRSNTLGMYNTANGFYALRSNTTGMYNTASGDQALDSNTTGIYNTGTGFEALRFNTTGSYNTAIGSAALLSNTIGENNTATGVGALADNTTGDVNTANGYYALLSNTTGYANTANGADALYSNSTGYYNTANGADALYSNTTGKYNTANGFMALFFNTTGNYNTALGNDADVLYDTLTNATAIGYGATVDASNKVRIGNASVTSIGGQVGWTTFSDRRYKKIISENVPGLDFISKLKPVTYTMDVDAIDAALKPARKPREGETEDAFKLSTEEIASRQGQSQKAYTGFIAQEVEKAARETGYDFSGVDAPKNAEGMYGLRYAEFVVPLVKAVQEQQESIKEQQEQIKMLEQRVAELEKK
jgi:hypothetical protein